MSLEAELQSLTLSEVLNAGGVAELYAIPRSECPLLDKLEEDAQRDQARCTAEGGLRHGLLAATVALRALILTARQKPLPALERFLAEVSMLEFGEALRGLCHRDPTNGELGNINLQKLAEFSPPIVWAAKRRIEEFRPIPDDRREAVIRGLSRLCPVLAFAAAQRAAATLEETEL